MKYLFTTDSYFNIFPILTDCLKKKSSSIDEKKIIFCEAKISLMVERHICAHLGGTFNTSVYSFGKYLRAQKNFDKLLSKEGSAMAIKKILSEVSLKCFKQSKTNLAPTLYDLIIQLKSAKITPRDILQATTQTTGVLKDKLSDIYLIFNEYENFIANNGFEDQSSLLTYLPDIILNSDEIASSDIYLVGFGSFTAQMRSIISALLDRAKSVTAILTEGQNSNVFVNETANSIRELCQKKNYQLVEEFIASDYLSQSKKIIDNLFNPNSKANKKDFSKGLELKETAEKIYYYKAKTPIDEVLRVGETIKKLVKNENKKYKEIAIAISDIGAYKEILSQTFNMLEIPYFLDEQKAPLNHPLITLVLSYIDIFRKGYDRQSVLEFCKNPLFISDKTLADNFENYLIQYNINYRRIFSPFTFESKKGVDLKELEKVRQSLCLVIEHFNVKKLFDKLKVEENLNVLSKKLELINENEQSAITKQIFKSVSSLLDEMDLILSGTKLSYVEFKNVFLSGVSSLKLSIIPQHNDAVFVGEFKEIALAKSKELFVIGLNSAVPKISLDVSLISDSDISLLEDIKVLVEPKIRVVNAREREYLAMALSAFGNRLFLSYSMAGVDGKKTEKSQVIDYIEALFNLQDFDCYNGYLTKKQAVKSFARACGEFAEGKTINDMDYDFTIPSSFYSVYDKEELLPLLNNANKEVKERLTGDNVCLIKQVSSPTTIEKYFKCPYSAFVQNFLKIKQRETGEVDSISIGIIMHEVLNKYIKQIKPFILEGDLDKNQSDQMVEQIIKELLNRDIYKKYISDNATLSSVLRLTKESKEYCFKTYLSLKKSSYSSCNTEVSFGDEKWNTYPAISLLDGKFKLKGKIDRVDENQKYFRVIDYKTSAKTMPETGLYSGTQLQLYLYAGAVRQNEQGEKQPAGLYYLPIVSNYQKGEDVDKFVATGKTLNEEDAILSNDSDFFALGKTDFVNISIDEKKGTIKNATDKQTINAYIDYAIKISESAVKNLSEGVIKPSPYDDACKYCEYSALCGMHDIEPRKVPSQKDFFKNDKGEDADE